MPGANEERLAGNSFFVDSQMMSQGQWYRVYDAGRQPVLLAEREDRGLKLHVDVYADDTAATQATGGMTR